MLRYVLSNITFKLETATHLSGKGAVVSAKPNTFGNGHPNIVVFVHPQKVNNVLLSHRVICNLT